MISFLQVRILSPAIALQPIGANNLQPVQTGMLANRKTEISLSQIYDTRHSIPIQMVRPSNREHHTRSTRLSSAQRG